MNWITTIGLVAASCTTISFIPQAVKIFKTKHTKDLSLGMYVLFSAGVLLWLIYGIFNRDMPVILANAIALSLALVILAFKIRYK